MVIEEHKSTAKYGRSKLRFNFLHESDPMRMSIHERRREKRFDEGKKMLEQMLLDIKLDALAAEFVDDFDALTKAGGDIPAIYSLPENHRAAIDYSFKHAIREIKYSGVDDLAGFKIIEDLQARAQKLLTEPDHLIQMRHSHKWWHY